MERDMSTDLRVRRRRALRRFSALVAVGMIMGWKGAAVAQTTAPLDLISMFRKEYPAAAAKHEKAYSHVRMAGTLTRTPDTTPIHQKDQIRLMREGESFGAYRTVLESMEGRWPQRAIGVYVSTPEAYFEAIRLPSEDHFKVTSDPPGPHGDSPARDPAFFAAYCIEGQRVADFLTRGDIQLTTAAMPRVTGEQVIKVTFVQYDRDSSQKKDQAIPTGRGPMPVFRGSEVDGYVGTFRQSDWELLEWVSPSNPRHVGTAYHGKITYQPNTTPPKITRIEYWEQSLQYHGLSTNNLTYQISDVEFGPVPAKDFSVDAAESHSQSEPANSSGSSPAR